MAELPPGIVTKTLTISPAASTGPGISASLEIYISPTQKVVYWKPTGQPVSDFFSVIRTTPDMDAVIRFPATDQQGFVDDNGDGITDWTYTVIVRYLRDGRKVGQKTTKYFRPTLSSADVQDFDLIPEGEIPILQGAPGPRGFSAYELAVQNGFMGSETEWLLSLEAAGRAFAYHHVQNMPSTTWVIRHNLGYFPGGVSLFDSADRFFWAPWQHQDKNTLIVTLSAPVAGQADIS